jgi:flagellar basal body L-ring protein FlgH
MFNYQEISPDEGEKSKETLNENHMPSETLGSLNAQLSNMFQDMRTNGVGDNETWYAKNDDAKEEMENEDLNATGETFGFVIDKRPMKHTKLEEEEEVPPPKKTKHSQNTNNDNPKTKQIKEDKTKRKSIKK